MKLESPVEVSQFGVRKASSPIDVTLSNSDSRIRVLKSKASENDINMQIPKVESIKVFPGTANVNCNSGGFASGEYTNSGIKAAEQTSHPNVHPRPRPLSSLNLGQ